VSADVPELLDVEDVIELHATQLEIFGGSAGIRGRAPPGVRRCAAAGFVRVGRRTGGPARWS
jgi:hypothetical protein